MDRDGAFDVLEAGSPLSGEFADDYGLRELSNDLALDEEDDGFGDAVAAYEDAYFAAFEREAERQVELLRGPTLDFDPDAAYAVGAGTVAWRYVGQTFGGRAQLVMIGDDKVWTFDADEVRPLDDDDYCASCGQVGCRADGRPSGTRATDARPTPGPTRSWPWWRRCICTRRATT